LIVRDADDMEIAQRFSAGSGVNQLTEPVKRATAISRDMVDSKLCRPFHGLGMRITSDPSAEAPGYFHTVRCRGRRLASFLLKAFSATITCFFFVALCFSQARDYPKEIRGYKVERAAVELKARENQKVAKTTQGTPDNNNNSVTAGTAPASSAPTPSPAAAPVSNVDQLITFGGPSLARVTPLGITLNIPVVVAPIKQSGHVDFLLFEDMTVNKRSVEIDEYHRGFDLPTKKPLTLREPLRFYVSLSTAALAAIDESVNSNETWPVTGRVYVCGKYKKFVFSFKRCVPVELNLTMNNPLRRK
jgi:hypothetical protein